MSNQSLGCSVLAVSLPMQLGVAMLINFPHSLAKSYLCLLKDSEKLLVGVRISERMSDDDDDDNDC